VQQIAVIRNQAKAGVVMPELIPEAEISERRFSEKASPYSPSA